MSKRKVQEIGGEVKKHSVRKLPKVGDVVRFYPVAGRKIYEEHAVREVIPEGIPSCREPMLMLDGRAGVVLAEHCRVVDYYSGRTRLYCNNCQESPYDSCGCP